MLLILRYNKDSMIVCRKCSQTFKPNSNSQKDCIICTTANCKQCGISFRFKPVAEKGWFCSKKCFDKSRIGTLAWNSNTAKPYTKCIDCKETTSSTKTIR